MYPRLFQFGLLSVPTYGVFAALALVAGLMLAMRTAARVRIPPDAMWNLGLITIFSAVLGSRLLSTTGHWHDFLSYPVLMLSLSFPPTVDSVLMRFALGIFAGLLYMSFKRLPWLLTLDAAAPACALGRAILLLGCLFAGCDYGRPTTVPWGIVFHSRWAAMWNGTPLGVRLHPVQLYGCGVELALCWLSLWWLPRRRQAGEVAGAWMFLSGLAQFFLDFYRGENRLLIFNGALSLTQAIDFGMVIIGALLLLEHRRTDIATRPTPGVRA